MLQSTFPELEKGVNVFSDSMLHFLKTFPSARLIASIGEKELRQAFILPDKRMRLVLKPEKIREKSVYSTQRGSLPPTNERVVKRKPLT